LAIDFGITRTSVVNTMAAFVLNVVLNVVLLPVVGLVGAGIATLVSYVAMITVIPALDRRQRPVNRVLASAVLPDRFLEPAGPAPTGSSTTGTADRPSDAGR
jgi:Na+-driven multidrug efflux pump